MRRDRYEKLKANNDHRLYIFFDILNRVLQFLLLPFYIIFTIVKLVLEMIIDITRAYKIIFDYRMGSDWWLANWYWNKYKKPKYYSNK